MLARDEPVERLRRAIEELGGGDGAELVAEARIEARARVRSILTEAMVQSMLERAREELERGPASTITEPRPSPPPASERRPDPPPELGWYMYGVVLPNGASPPPGLPGVDPDHTVTMLRHGALAALVSQVPLEDFGEEPLRARLADMAWLEHTARRHEQVLDTVREHGTVIPMRLCSIYSAESGIREMLEREAKALEDALERLRDKTEWGVKVFVDQSGAHAGRTSGDADGGTSGGRTSGDADGGAEGSGTAYMQRRRQEHTQLQRLDREIEEACKQIHGRLCAVAVDGLTSSPQRPEVSDHEGQMVLNGAYLVHDGEQRRFDQEVRALQAEFAPGLELQQTGPWPAYNFIPGTVGAAR